MVFSIQTVFSNSAAPILRRLSAALEPFAKSRSHVLLFSISPAPSLPADELSELVYYFQSLRSERVGCLSAPAPLATPAHGYSGTSCSFAVFERDIATPFRSTIPGKETVQEFGHTTGTVDWESLWAQKTSKLDLPAGLEELRSEDVGTIVYFTDDAPEGLMNSLNTFKHADKLGLVTSSTPFVTGRPFTLFHNDDIVSTGAVGLCLSSRDTGRPAPLASVEFPTLRPVTDKLTVTSVEGNLIHALDDKNPSRILLNATEKLSETPGYASPTRDDKFLIGVCDGSELRTVYTVLSGDPSRGSIALEGESAPPIGSTVRIYWQPATTEPVHTVIASDSQREMQFVTTGPDSSLLWDGAMDGDTQVLHNTFYACSENGFVVSRKPGSDEDGEEAWRSSVLGGRIKLRWGA